jgi:hypothetical protein
VTSGHPLNKPLSRQRCNSDANLPDTHANAFYPRASSFYLGGNLPVENARAFYSDVYLPDIDASLFYPGGNLLIENASPFCSGGNLLVEDAKAFYPHANRPDAHASAFH